MIKFIQNNIKNENNILAAHSPVFFIVEVTYSEPMPPTVYVDITTESGEVLNFVATPYKDVASNIRQYFFRADEIFRSEMLDFNDFFTAENEISFVPNIQKKFNVKFFTSIFESVNCDVIAHHGAAQISESETLENIYYNHNELYFSGVGGEVYVYFFNEMDGNNFQITLDDELIEGNYALDFDETPFIFEDNILIKL